MHLAVMGASPEPQPCHPDVDRHGLLADAPTEIAATIQGFSARAVLTMLADTMMPEAFDEAGAAVGLATVLGYAIGALLTPV